MTVYVDPIVEYPAARCRGLPGRLWCHMATDDLSLTDLFALAERIGLRRGWFQAHPTLPHFDLTPARREAAVQAGAVSVSSGRVLLILTSASRRAALEQTPHGREMVRHALTERALRGGR